ncbi:pentatricopeptide repeat-containing protein At3g26782, mitochondrial-like [Aristolochia californica]|uniref:pentatricopeptide repeat-containing protein At3g26782, mitochondrial-like n=1 Tax=Aristolochia californica TaxID=171875 RepID=UPI0035DC4535
MDLMTTNRTSLITSLPLTFQNISKLNPRLKFNNNPSKQPSLVSYSPSQITLEQTKQIHARLIRTQFGHCCAVIDDPLLPQQTLEAQFNSLITSYTKNNCPRDSLRIYSHLRLADAFIDNFTIPSILKACGQLSKIKVGKEIHGFVLKAGFDWDVFVRNSLIQMYSECETVDSAERVFNKMTQRDVVSWSTMIGSYRRNKYFREALDLIKEMSVLAVKLDKTVVLNMINLFADMGVLEMGRVVHGYVIKKLDSEMENVSVCTALIDMYGKCGRTVPARQIFDRMSDKNVVTWTAMIAGYIHCGELVDGLELFVRMREATMSPNEVTILSWVIECGFAGALELGKLLHVYALKIGFDASPMLATALLDMYSKSGEVRIARAIFDRMEKRDVTAWTAMISGYAHSNCLLEAFNLFIHMINSNIEQNEVTMVSLLVLCAEAGALHLGKWVHGTMEKIGIDLDVVLATALIDMYAKCGEIDGANQVFVSTRRRDTSMLNAIMGGFAMHGRANQALELFHEMRKQKLKPNEITFVGVLHACSHAGLVEEGHLIFHQMVKDFGVEPTVQHYGCMVDLLGRAGKLNEAHEMIKSMPIQPNVIVWGALLASCKLHKNLGLAKLAARELLELEPHHCGYNVLLSNIYAAESRWHEVREIRKVMKETGMKKPPGLSSIEVNGVLHEFIIGDRSHPEIEKIDEKLAEMQKKLIEAGYEVNTSAVLLNIDEEEKETAIGFHTEKLAMAFGLISTAPNAPIRIMKNLRVCDDCHAATKLLSKIYGRLIIVRDRNRFHQFSEGSCTCRDYW